MKTNLVCKLYVQFHGNVALLESIVAASDVGDLDADVRRNPDFSPNRDLFPEDFLYFPLVIEIFDESDDETRHVRAVNTLLQALATRGANVVAACPWEELLKDGGQVRSES